MKDKMSITGLGAGLFLVLLIARAAGFAVPWWIIIASLWTIEIIEVTIIATAYILYLIKSIFN